MLAGVGEASPKNVRSAVAAALGAVKNGNTQRLVLCLDLLSALQAEAVRAAVGHAFMDKLGGYWQDGPDIEVVLTKDNPGVWIGERRHPQTGKKADPFYVMET